MSVMESSLKLWHACRPDSLRVLYHPFHSQLAKGKIPQISFKKYIQQDFICLEKSIQIYDNATQKFQPQPYIQQDLLQILTYQQNQLYLRKKRYLNYFDENEEKNPVENQYVKFLDEINSENNFLSVISSILPYQKLNFFVWSEFMHAYSDNINSDFFRWLNDCDLQQLNNIIQDMEIILDRLFKQSNFEYDQLLGVYQQTVKLYLEQINSFNINEQKRIGFLAVDFDETLSRKETISVLIDAIKFSKIQNAEKNKKETIEKEFQDEVNRLVKGYISASAELISSLNLTQNSISNGSTSINSKRLNEIISKFTEFERKMNQVVIDAKILSGVTKEQIQNEARSLELQPHCIQTLNKYINQNISTVIISVNWSAVLICSALNELNITPFTGHDYNVINVQQKSVVNVFSNELEFDNNTGLSTGGIVRRIECSEDKGNLYQILSQIYNENNQISTVFVGDSFGDIMGMLSADFGIIIGKNKQLRQVCCDVGIKIVPLLMVDTEKIEGQLYCVDNWQEIDAFLSWRVVQSASNIQQAVC
eukprot:TRINITY_DN8273_c2_g2_i1.p1 TRINITY_DN8273_c2_g2~~TRINITY_DN8273_c2_g2_i1.p1  ORF type:complete len:536 (-),score=67.23 TRINITY_DN8273_c2_g2_i1:148-1755(-)